MGGNSSKQNFDILNEFNFLGIRQDDGYGEIQLYHNKIKRTDQMALIKFYDSADMEKRLSIIQSRKLSPNQYFTKIIDYKMQTTEDLCSNISLLHIGLEFIEKSLQDDIIQRRSADKTYNEGELWYLAQTILFGLRELQLQNLSYQDLHPTNIRVRINGEIKLLELQCLANRQSAYQKVFSQLREVEYIAPEQLYVLENEHQNDKQEYSIEKQNVFALGVIFLVCITNTDVKKFYNGYSFNQELALKKLNSSFDKYNYSEPLKHLLTDLLQLNAYHRPTYLEILDKLSHVESSRISPSLYAVNQQDQYIKSTLNFKNSIGSVSEQIIESQPQSMHEQQQIIINDSFNKQITSNFQDNLEPIQMQEIKKPQIENNYDFEYNNPPLTTQAGLDKIRQLKEKFQMMKGEIPQQSAATVPTSFTHQDDLDTQRYLNQQSQNPYQPNFLEMDPIIQRALQKSREIMAKCNPYQSADPYVPILSQSNASFFPQTNMQSLIQPTQPVSLGGSQFNSLFPPQSTLQQQPLQQSNLQFQPLQQSNFQQSFQKQPTFSQQFSPFQQQQNTDFISPQKFANNSQYQQQLEFTPPSFNQLQQSQYQQQSQLYQQQPQLRNERIM